MSTKQTAAHLINLVPTTSTGRKKKEQERTGQIKRQNMSSRSIGGQRNDNFSSRSATQDGDTTLWIILVSLKQTRGFFGGDILKIRNDKIINNDDDTEKEGRRQLYLCQ